MTVVSLKSAHNGCFNRHRVDLQYDSRTTKASSSDIVHVYSSKLHVYLMHGDIAMPMNVWTAEDNSLCGNGALSRRQGNKVVDI